MRKIEWIIITEANMEEEVAKWTAGGKPLAVFAITAEGYENLGQNFSDIRALVQQQQSIILAYDNYYKASEEALDNAESDRALNAAVRASEESKGLDLNPFD
jgi:DNA-binding PadR family transcriptional regulator